jgi:hypothetical protein
MPLDCDRMVKSASAFGYPASYWRPTALEEGRTVEVYDGNLLLSFASYDGDNLLKREKTFHYGGSKLQSSESRYYLPDGTLVEHWLSLYGLEGRIAETYGLKGDGRPLGDGKYKYEYDPEGRTSRVWTFNDLVPDDSARKLGQASGFLPIAWRFNLVNENRQPKAHLLSLGLRPCLI